MGTVLYSASPFESLFSVLGTPIGLLVLGIIGLGWAITNRNQGRGSRIGAGIAGGFLVIVGLIYGALSLGSLLRGGTTVSVLLNSKQVAQDNCNNGDTCTRYVLETSTENVYYDFDVPSGVYDAAQINTCYQISYYDSRSPFNVAADTQGYHQVSAVTRVQLVDPSTCK